MLSPEQQEQFRSLGWTVARAAFDPARVRELARALDGVVPAWSYASGFEGRVVEVASISRGSAEIARHARDPKLAALGAAALGAARLQLLQDTAFIKPAEVGGRVEWHQDYSYFAFLDRPAVVTLRLALTACTRENGCLRVISGSHRWGLQGADLSFRARTVDDALGALPEALRERARTDEVVIELQPGDVSLHHCLTFHSSEPNRSERSRKTLAVRLADAGCKLVPEKLPSPEAAAHFPADADGHLAGPSFPVVFGG